jgi:hypothetical protein
MVRILIAGSRSFDDYSMLRRKVVVHLINNSIPMRDVVIISGRAAGADALGEQFAERFGLPVETYPAAWNDLSAEPCIIGTNKHGRQYNKLAGMNRNKIMVDRADHIIVFWDGKSKGTKDDINLAKKAGKPLEIVMFDKDNEQGR